MSFSIVGIHHVKLTVSDLERSKSFYSSLPGFKLVSDHPDFVMFQVGKIYIGITNHKVKLETGSFSEFRCGLDHLALSVGSEEDLKEALIYLKDRGIPHGDIQTLSNKTVVLPFRDPDNIQLEFAFKP